MRRIFFFPLFTYMKQIGFLFVFVLFTAVCFVFLLEEQWGEL